MPGRTYTPTYRYNYQGQENAVNSKWQAFELRLHNSDLGRWMSPDPYGQFYSPYISMGNNPVSGVDPDGGFVNGLSQGWINAMGADMYSQWMEWNHGFSRQTAYYEGQYRKIADIAEMQRESNIKAFMQLSEIGAGDNLKFNSGELSSWVGDNEDDFNSGWEKKFDAAIWSRNLIYSYWDATKSGLDKEQANEAANVYNRFNSFKEVGEYILKQTIENDNKMRREFERIGITLPTVHVEDVKYQLHYVVQHVLDNLDHYSRVDLAGVTWNQIGHVAINEQKPLKASGRLDPDYTFEKILLPGKLFKSALNLTSLNKTKGGGNVVTVGRWQYVGPRYKNTTRPYQRSIKKWNDAGGKRNSGGWEHIYDWNTWHDFFHQ